MKKRPELAPFNGQKDERKEWGDLIAERSKQSQPTIIRIQNHNGVDSQNQPKRGIEQNTRRKDQKYRP